MMISNIVFSLDHQNSILRICRRRHRQIDTPREIFENYFFLSFLRRPRLRVVTAQRSYSPTSPTDSRDRCPSVSRNVGRAPVLTLNPATSVHNPRSHESHPGKPTRWSRSTRIRGHPGSTAKG